VFRFVSPEGVGIVAAEFKYQERVTLGRGWSLEVLRRGIVIGYIGRNPMSGEYRYYKGIHNELTPTFCDDDLEALKKKIAANA
jgi:hypothetical protein